MPCRGREGLDAPELHCGRSLLVTMVLLLLMECCLLLSELLQNFQIQCIFPRHASQAGCQRSSADLDRNCASTETELAISSADYACSVLDVALGRALSHATSYSRHLTGGYSSSLLWGHCSNPFLVLSVQTQLAQALGRTHRE